MQLYFFLSLVYIRRWFTLKSDYCLHYYKTESSVVPLGAVSLANCQLRHVQQYKGNEDNSYDHIFQIQRLNGPPLILAASSQELKDEWMNVIDTAIQQSSQVSSVFVLVMELSMWSERAGEIMFFLPSVYRMING